MKKPQWFLALSRFFKVDVSKFDDQELVTPFFTNNYITIWSIFTHFIIQMFVNSLSRSNAT